jgi:acyl-coenzyme A thioesterase PaaI-like protein
MDPDYLSHARVTVLDAGADAANVRMDDDPCLDNHLASRHAGALFSLVDAAAAALVERTSDPVGGAGDGWGRRRTTIRYERIARGPLTATARWTEQGIAVEVKDESGRVVVTADAVSAAVRDFEPARRDGR